MKKIILGTVAVFFTWAIMDFVIHHLLLGEAYAATAELWRPMEEMKMGLMYGVTLISALTFVLIYAKLIQPKSSTAGMTYGLLFGLGAGVSMGFGTYSFMPLPLSLAASWCLGAVVEGLAAGWVVAAIIKN